MTTTNTPTTFDPTDCQEVATIEGVGTRYTVWANMADGTCTAVVEGYGPVKYLPPPRPLEGAVAVTFAAAVAAVVNDIEADCDSTTRLVVAS